VQASKRIFESVLVVMTRRTLAVVNDEVLRQRQAEWLEFIASTAYANAGPVELFDRTLGHPSFDITLLCPRLPLELETILCVEIAEELVRGRSCAVFNLGDFESSAEGAKFVPAFGLDSDIDRLPSPEPKLKPPYAKAAKAAIALVEETIGGLSVASREVADLHDATSEILSSVIKPIVQRFAGETDLPLILKSVRESYLDFQALAIAYCTYHAYTLTFWRVLKANSAVTIAGIGRFEGKPEGVRFLPVSALRKPANERAA
jgi:hypothetical protein